MALPDSYTLKPSAIPAYFDALLRAQAPERVSTRFLERLGFKTTTDRLLIGILKELGFINADGVPAERYHRFHDRSQWKLVLAEAIRNAYSDLFAVNQSANGLSAEDVANKLRTLYAGKKSDEVIGRIARTFTGLCELADFSATAPDDGQSPFANPSGMTKTNEQSNASDDQHHSPPTSGRHQFVALDSLQYHINIALPESRDQAVYDAIFKSLKDHLGR